VIIRVVYPNDRPGPEHAMVQLRANTGVTVGQSFTNSEGQVTFSNIPPGTYQVKVSGMDLEDTETESFVVERNDSMHMEWVHVKPKENAGGTAVGSTQGVVSASDLQASGKAKKELNKGNEAFLANDMKKAIEHYQKATKEYPQYATAYNNLGAAYMRLEDRASAREAFAKAAEADPNMPSANANLARIYILDKQSDQAIPLLNRALSGAPKDPEFLMLMARAQLETRNFEEAVTYAHKAHEQPHPKYPFIHLIAGQALQAQNKPDEARLEYQIFIKEAPDAPQAAQVRSVIGQLAASAAGPK
jgi:tetratricopeptide (TPR) repeat protein